MENHENEFPTQEPAETPTSTDSAPVLEPAPEEGIPACETIQQDENDAPAPIKRKKSGHVLLALTSIFLSLVMVTTGCALTAFMVTRHWQNVTEDLVESFSAQMKDIREEIKDNSFTGNGNSVSGTPNVSPDGMTPGQVYAKCADSVVAIICTSPLGNSTGSGFILSADGYIMTNYHVVQNATWVTVTISDNTTHTAQVIGYDDTNDIALLKVDLTDLPAVSLGSSDDLIIGDQVVAIGNPLGELTSTLTVGYISAKERDVSTDGTVINMLQTDAAINDGNSGGPLFNMKGEVIGITTAKYSGTTTSGASIEGIGFAIPIDDITEKIQQLQEFGYVSTPYMGVSVSNLNVNIGAYVSQVENNSGAKAAGIKIGDIIIGLGEHKVSSVESLTQALKNFQVGDTTTVAILRNQQIIQLTITLGEKPRATAPNA